MKYEKLVGKIFGNLTEEEKNLFCFFYGFEEIDGNFYLIIFDENSDEEKPDPILKVQLKSKPDILKTYDEYVKECEEQDIKEDDIMDEVCWSESIYQEEDLIVFIMEEDIDPETIVERY